MSSRFHVVSTFCAILPDPIFGEPTPTVCSERPRTTNDRNRSVFSVSVSSERVRTVRGSMTLRGSGVKSSWPATFSTKMGLVQTGRDRLSDSGVPGDPRPIQLSKHSFPSVCRLWVPSRVPSITHFAGQLGTTPDSPRRFLCHHLVQAVSSKPSKRCLRSSRSDEQRQKSRAR